MNETPPRLVERRCIVHISGFEPVTPETLDRRMRSGLKKFAPLWGATSTASKPELSADGRAMRWDVETKGPNYATSCRYTVLRWDELMMPYVERPWIWRMVDGYKALLEFAVTGTIGRYFKANVRYGLFVIYPVILLVLFALAAVAAGIAAAALGVPVPWLSAPVIAIAVFLLALRFVGAYFYLDFALADWAFAADLSRRDVTGLDEILGRFAEEVLANMRDPEADEVLLSSVSLGAVMLIEALARAYVMDPDLARHARRAAFLTVGSSLLKIGLHPGAGELRKVVGRIGGEPSLFWVEYQAKVDLINFYKTDPVRDMGLAATGRPIVQTVRIRDMMTAADYRKAQRNSLLLHRQFVMPNGQRYFYDFYQICFGPMPLAERVRLGGKAAQRFAKDGSYGKKRAKGRKAAMAAGE